MMILEAAIRNVKPGGSRNFEAAFKQASAIIAASPGYIEHQLQRCLEAADKYPLLVRWETPEDHTDGFRGSVAYGEWRRLLHHFYEPFPVVEHFTQVTLESRAAPGRTLPNERLWYPGAGDRGKVDTKEG